MIEISTLLIRNFNRIYTIIYISNLELKKKKREEVVVHYSNSSITSSTRIKQLDEFDLFFKQAMGPTCNQL